MTAAMEAMHRRLPKAEQYPLPPREIIDRVLPSPDDDRLGDAERRDLALAAHFLYGALTGAAYAPLASGTTGDAVRRGTAYGLAVWALSYIGWIPLCGILRPATEHPVRRDLLMLGAHAVWGLSTALLFNSAVAVTSFEGRGRRDRDQPGGGRHFRA
jgi:uncharacterized membrane protein YagU involved in acid resistance